MFRIRHASPFAAGALAGALALALALGGAPPAEAAGGKLTVIAGAATNGEVTTCGCAKKRLGGIDKRPTVIKAARASRHAVIVVDAGDIGERKGQESWPKTLFLWDMMGKMGYDAVTPGEQDLVAGLAALKAMYAAHPQVKAVSANLRTRDGAPVLPEYAVIEKNGLRIGVTGVTEGSYYTLNVTRGLQKLDEFTFESPKAALARVVPVLNREADVVLVLLHVGAGDAKRLLAEVPGVDVAVVGHNPGYSFDPEQAGATWVLRAGERGQYLCVLDAMVAADGTLTDVRGEGRPLGELVANDPAFVPAVKDWVKAHPEDKPK